MSRPSSSWKEGAKPSDRAADAAAGLAAAVESRVAHPMRRAIYRTVAAIPAGRVATYGQVARVAGYPGRARQVGYALAATPEGLELPWQRVINAQGRVSPRAHTGWHGLQQALLEAEGVVFVAGRVDLQRFGWQDGGGEVPA